MRRRPVAALLALVLAACSSSPDVLVTGAEPNAPSATVAPTSERVSVATTPGERTAAEPELTPRDEARADEWPPLDEEWTGHPLASLVPAPAELDADLGGHWTYDYGYTNSAEDPNPVEAIDGCDAPVPPDLEGLTISYSRRDAGLGEGIEVELGQGSEADARAVIDSFVGVTGCDLSDVGFSGGFEMVEATPPPGASDWLVLVGTAGMTQPVTAAIALARYDGMIIAAFQFTGGTVDEAVDQVVAVVALIAARR